MYIAVLITCHNRCATTIACLETLSVQQLPPNTTLTIYLVDDGSTDHTSSTVMQRFPHVYVIPGDGSLYWGEGMRLAWRSAAAQTDYDAYLWLNDDVILFPGAIATLVRSAEQADAIGRPGVIAGSTCDPDTGKLTYGGLRHLVTPIEPVDTLQPCDTMVGNIVLVPRDVYQVVGNITPAFRHNGGDRDYGHRAHNAGFHNWIAPGYLGACRQNGSPAWRDPSLPLAARWRYLNSPKGVPLRERYLFCKRHHGITWPLDLVKLCLHVMFPREWRWLKSVTGRT
jgi:GT2 family glycosyltransferase